LFEHLSNGLRAPLPQAIAFSKPAVVGEERNLVDVGVEAIANASPRAWPLLCSLLIGKEQSVLKPADHDCLW
jgi:hypothetical protein